MIRLRVRGPQGSKAIEVSSESTVTDLKATIAEAVGLSGTLELRIGFPPKPLDLSSFDAAAPLHSLPVKLDGEQITISSSNTSDTSRTTVSSPPQTSGDAPPTANKASQSQSGANNAQFSLNKPMNAVPVIEDKSVRKFRKSKGDDDLDLEPPVLPVSTHPGDNLVLRIMEDDNSCLFRAVNYVFMRDMDMMQQFRLYVANTIQEDAQLPEADQQFTDAILGMSRSTYCEKIQFPDTWGGAIELAILAKFADLEIWSIDVSTGRIDRFNEGRPTCGIVIYSGIHYDCLALTPTPYTNDNDVTTFSVDDQGILEAANKLATILRGRHYFTDTAKFTLKCDDCGRGMKGEREANEHFNSTGHHNFSEH